MTTPGMKFRPDLRYSLLTVMYLSGIYWLSSIPDLSTHERPLLDLAQNIGHAPLYAGLAFLVLKSGSGIPASSWPWKAAVLLAGAACAALDEWHQSFVRGRFSSLGDFLVDLIGMGGMLAFLHWRAVRATRRQAPDVGAPDKPTRSGLLAGNRLAAQGQPGTGYRR
jgi:VanZ family protein